MVDWWVSVIVFLVFFWFVCLFDFVIEINIEILVYQSDVFSFYVSPVSL